MGIEPGEQRKEQDQMDAYEVRHLQVIAEHDQIDAALVEADARRDVAAARDIVLAALRNGAYMLCLRSCPRDGGTCGRLWLDDGEHVRVPYGARGVSWRALPCARRPETPASTAARSRGTGTTRGASATAA